MSENNLIQKSANQIWNVFKTGNCCSPVRSIIGDSDLASAYAVQHLNTQRRLERGEHIIGAKIGLTSEAVQKQLGVSQPDYGLLTDSMRAFSEIPIPFALLQQPKVEAEIAFMLSEDLGVETVTMDHLVKCISSAVACIEIVGSRIDKWDIRITDTIADNASASHFVLGEAVEGISSIDLVNCKMEMTRGSEVVSTGQGSACMGNPLNAALWLANTMAELGRPLRAGDVILAGALGPMVPVMPGDSFTANIEGLGTVSVSFGG